MTERGMKNHESSGVQQLGSAQFWGPCCACCLSAGVGAGPAVQGHVLPNQLSAKLPYQQLKQPKLGPQGGICFALSRMCVELHAAGSNGRLGHGCFEQAMLEIDSRPK